MKGIEMIKFFCYGNHPQSSEYKEIAGDIMRYLDSQGEASRKELMRHLDMNPSSDTESDRFYNIMRPLKGKKNSNPLPLAVISTYERNGETFYYLSRDAYDASVNAMNQSVRYFLDEKD